MSSATALCELGKASQSIVRAYSQILSSSVEGGTPARVRGFENIQCLGRLNRLARYVLEGLHTKWELEVMPESGNPSKISRRLFVMLYSIVRPSSDTRGTKPLHLPCLCLQSSEAVDAISASSSLVIRRKPWISLNTRARERRHSDFNLLGRKMSERRG